MDFIVFQWPNTIGITGNILTVPEHLPTLKVQHTIINIDKLYDGMGLGAIVQTG